MGFESAESIARAALHDEVARMLSAPDGCPARAALESAIAVTFTRLGYEPSVESPTPLDWYPTHLGSQLSEHLLIEAWIRHCMEAGIRPRHTGAASNGALSPKAWIINKERTEESPLLYEPTV